MENGQSIELAGTGQRLIFRARSPESVVYESFLPAQQSGLVPDGEGRHEQRYEVVEGTLIFRVDGTETLLTAGGRLTVPPGVRCSFWNPGTDGSHLVAEVRPGLGFETYIRTREEGGIAP